MHFNVILHVGDFLDSHKVIFDGMCKLNMFYHILTILVLFQKVPFILRITTLIRHLRCILETKVIGVKTNVHDSNCVCLRFTISILMVFHINR